MKKKLREHNKELKRGKIVFCLYFKNISKEVFGLVAFNGINLLFG